MISLRVSSDISTLQSIENISSYVQWKSLNVWSVYIFFTTLSCQNYLFQGVWGGGVYKIVVEIPEGWGGGVKSDFCNITFGIPQGSILSPLLFTIYINDLPSRNLFSKPRMYADDTTLTTFAEDPCVLEHKMNYDMNLIQSWLQSK